MSPEQIIFPAMCIICALAVIFIVVLAEED